MTSNRVAFVVDRLGYLDVFSIPILASIAKKAGHEVILVEYDPDPHAAVEKLKRFAPKVLAYSITSPDVRRYRVINREIRSHVDALSLFGGAHPTYFPEFIEEEHVDAVCVGEGDTAFPRLLDTVGTDAMYEIPNLHFKMPDGTIRKNAIGDLVADLNDLPPPDRDLVFQTSDLLRALPIRTFFAGRGCPYLCTYCFNHSYNEMYKGKGKILRTKTVDNLISEIRDVIDRYPTKFLKFHDDVFGLDRKWLAEFAERFPKEIGLPFLCYVRPNMVTDEWCAQLAKAGCYSVSIAIEAGNEEIRNKILRRNLTDEKVLSAFHTLYKHGIRTYALNMLGLPEETPADLLRTIRLNRECKVTFGDASIFQPYPGTDVTEYCKRAGYLDEGVETWTSQYSDSLLNFPPEFKRKVYVTHRLFPIAVDYPVVEKLIPVVEKLLAIPGMRKVLDVFYRFYYGSRLQARIYPARIPLRIKLRTAMAVLFSKSRT